MKRKIVEGARANLSDAEVGGVSRFGGIEIEDWPKYFLVPGDPDRVQVMADQWDAAQVYHLPRGYCLAAGMYKGMRIGALSSGIGGPSLEIVLSDAAALGTHTFLRVGTTGSLRENIANGDLIILEGSVRLDGLSNLYVRSEYPAAASYECILALVQAAELTQAAYHVGIGATTASFYAGQGRVSYGGYIRSETKELISDMQQARVLNFEMEAAALFTLCRLFGLRSGAVCSVVANRISGEWGDRGGIEKACRVGAEAAFLLHQWDLLRKQAGKEYFFPGLLEPAK